MNELRRVGESEYRSKSPFTTGTGACRLRSTHKSRESGFTVIELLIACMVLLTISAIAVPHLMSAMNQAKVARAVGDVRTLGDAIMGYEAVNHVYPNTLTDVGYGANKDPWGNPYQYVNLVASHGSGARTDRFLVPLNNYFDVYSMGKDGLSALPLTDTESQDDVVWAYDGGFDGQATDY